MSKFFIEHPVLANVLAIVLVVIGAVSLYRLPVSEYPNVVPPTVQVTASYPGASAQTVINTVALPIENQVNGVDQMLYMESTSAPDGTYSLTVTFEIGTDPNIDQVLVQNRVQLALASLPEPVQAQGVSVQKKNTAILQIVTLDSPDGKYDSLYHEQLRDDQPRRRARAAARRRQRQGVRRRQLRDADLDGSAEAAVVRPASRRTSSTPSASKARTSPPARSACRPRRRTPQFQYTVDIQSRLDEPGPIRQHRRQGPDRAGRPAGPCQRRRAASNSARRPMRRISASTASRPPASPSIRRRKSNSLQVGKEVKAAMDADGEAVPARACTTPSPTTPRCSSRTRSPRSTRRCTRPASWS